MIKSWVLLCVFFFGYFVPGQSQKYTANTILQKTYHKILGARDYSVSAHITTDLPFIKMLPVNARLYFKQKNKLRVISQGIAVLPRQGFNQLSGFISDTAGFVCISQGFESTEQGQLAIINIIPLSDTSDLILGKLWIETTQFLILKSQLTTRTNGTILTAYKYGPQSMFGLPDELTFTVDLKKFKIPKLLAADLNNSKTPEKETKKEDKKGKIVVRLNNYSVNRGIPDSFFKEKDENK